MVYLSLLDSDKYFQPNQYRTITYQNILLGYFEFISNVGFDFLCLWSFSSLSENIFYKRPKNQKNPDQYRLTDWYISLFNKATDSQIIKSFDTTYNYLDNHLKIDDLSLIYQMDRYDTDNEILGNRDNHFVVELLPKEKTVNTNLNNILFHNSSIKYATYMKRLCLDNNYNFQTLSSAQCATEFILEELHTKRIYICSKCQREQNSYSQNLCIYCLNKEE